MKMSETLFRVFLLEDDEYLQGDLKAILEARLEGVSVIAADCISTGLQLLKDAPPPDLAILDVRVPFARKGQPKADDSVWRKMKDKEVPCIMVTSYVNSADVAKYLDLVGSRTAIIEKCLGSDFIPVVIDLVQKSLTDRISRRIECELRAMRGGEPGRCIPSCGTPLLLRVGQQIQDYWKYLDDAARAEVREMFIVDETNGRSIRLRLI